MICIGNPHPAKSQIITNLGSDPVQVQQYLKKNSPDQTLTSKRGWITS